MKLYKNAIILVIVSLLLVASYFVTNKKNSNKNVQDGTNLSTIKVLNLNPDNITEIETDNKKDKLIFKKSENKWKLIEPSDIKYDQALADGLPLSIFYVTASKLIAEKVDDPAQYGLDNPSVISIKTTDGKLNILEIGDETSNKDSYYFKVKGNDKVYIIDKNKVDAILMTTKGIRDKNVLALRRELQSRMLADDISFLTIKKNGDLVFSAMKSENDGSWSLTAPVKANVNKDKITPILNAISKVMALEFIDENPNNLEKYGLKNPSYSLEFKNSIGKKELLIGDEKEVGSRFYAMVKGSKEVFTLNEAGFSFLDKPLKEFLSK